MYPTRWFRRWIADNVSDGTSLGIALGSGLAVAATDGVGFGGFAVGAELAAGGEQAARRRVTSTSVGLAGFITHITKAHRIGYPVCHQWRAC
jgi:hypothetical protein